MLKMCDCSNSTVHNTIYTDFMVPRCTYQQSISLESQQCYGVGSEIDKKLLAVPSIQRLDGVFEHAFEVG